MENKLQSPEELMVQLQELDAETGLGLFNEDGALIVRKTVSRADKFTREYFARICPDDKCPETLDELLQNPELTARVIDVAVGMALKFPIRPEGFEAWMMAPPPTEWPLNETNKTAFQEFFDDVIVATQWYKGKQSLHGFWCNNGGFGCLTGIATIFENGCAHEDENAALTMDQIMAAKKGTRTYWLSQSYGLVE